MNKQKLATAGCIVLSILFSLSFGLFIHFKLFWPMAYNNYEKSLYYPEDLYKEYRKEAERMILHQNYNCKYPAKTTLSYENGQTTLVIKIGDYDEGFTYSNYITATVKNFGTSEQEIAFERSRENAEKAYADAINYRNTMIIFTVIFVFILISFTVYLIINSIKKCYKKVFYPILLIIFTILSLIFSIHFLFA